jgi:hypothetical protein
LIGGNHNSGHVSPVRGISSSRCEFNVSDEIVRLVFRVEPAFMCNEKFVYQKPKVAVNQVIGAKTEE